MRLKHTVHDGNFRIRDLVHSYVTSLIPCVGRVGQEEKVSTVECRFHGATGVCQRVKQTVQPSGNSYLRTTTMGDSVLKNRPKPFHSINPDATTDAKLSI